MRGIVSARSGSLGGILLSLHFTGGCGERKGAGRAPVPPASCSSEGRGRLK